MCTQTDTQRSAAPASVPRPEGKQHCVPGMFWVEIPKLVASVRIVPSWPSSKQAQ